MRQASNVACDTPCVPILCASLSSCRDRMAELPDLPGEPHQPVSFSFLKRTFGKKVTSRNSQPQWLKLWPGYIMMKPFLPFVRVSTSSDHTSGESQAETRSLGKQLPHHGLTIQN